jgi:hypothetical protein
VTYAEFLRWPGVAFTPGRMLSVLRVTAEETEAHGGRALKGVDTPTNATVEDWSIQPEYTIFEATDGHSPEKVEVIALIILDCGLKGS